MFVFLNFLGLLFYVIGRENENNAIQPGIIIYHKFIHFLEKLQKYTYGNFWLVQEVFTLWLH